MGHSRPDLVLKCMLFLDFTYYSKEEEKLWIIQLMLMLTKAHPGSKLTILYIILIKKRV